MSYDFYEDDETAEFERPKAKRRAGAILLGVALAVVLVGCGTVATLLKGRDHDTPVASATKDTWSTPTPAGSVAPTTEAPVAVVTSAAPTSPAPSPSKTKKKPSPKATETVQAPAHPHTTQPGCPPSRGPSQLAKSKVREYLDTASTTAFWGTATDPDYADIRVPVRLLYAVADQESGWQSSITACDGGVGIMQIMPTTQTFVNGRFATHWDRAKPSDNVMLGGNYLAWLIAYYGPKLGTYDMTQAKLLNAVISAYNWGTNGVDYAGGVYPNQQYVNNVRALMTSCCGNY